MHLHRIAPARAWEYAHWVVRKGTEASGGITLATIRAVAETGVDIISLGALTHSAKALDISLELCPD